MPTYDFACERHGDFEDLIPLSDIERMQADGGSISSPCPECGTVSPLVWRRAPGMLGEENVPREQLAAARDGNVFGAENYIPPFTGSTRSELREWERTFNVVPHTAGERQSGRLELNQKKEPWVKTPEGKRKHEEILAQAAEIARAGDEAVMRELEQRAETPNEFDVNAFAAQAGAGMVPDPEVNGVSVPTTAIAEDLSVAVNQ
jgi:hypothetical protein